MAKSGEDEWPSFEDLQAFVEAPGFEEELREAERLVAEDAKRNPAEAGVTAEKWEEIRQWPGEYIEPEEER
jgi:hypothetical protein